MCDRSRGGGLVRAAPRMRVLPRPAGHKRVFDRMNASPGPAGNQRAFELLRWVGVFPAALLAGLTTRSVVVMLSRLVGLGAAVTAGSELAHCFRLLVYYVPSEAAFVAA